MIRLLLCDLDGTLVEAWLTTALPGVRERLRGRRDQGVSVVVVIHPGGVGSRYAHAHRGTWALPANPGGGGDVRLRRGIYGHGPA